MVIFFCQVNTIRPDLALGHMAGKTGSSMPVCIGKLSVKKQALYMIPEIIQFANTKNLIQSTNILDYYEKLQKCKNDTLSLQK